MHSSIVLLSKPSGITSFNALFGVKKALSTKKVGHTGTLDSFADGLLVVLTGTMTHLVPHITALSKTYQAVIAFGEETDTLEPTGTVVKTAPLPTTESFLKAVTQWTGNLMQEPPVFSALHVGGARASDLVRRGHEVTLEKRPVTVFSSNVISLQTVENNGIEYVKYAIIETEVSKGTYIRSLARDIAYTAGSCCHLIGLRRTKVGNFSLENAANYAKLPELTVEHALSLQSTLSDDATIRSVLDSLFTQDSLSDIAAKSVSLDRQTAALCGLTPLTLLPEYLDSYNNGIRISPSFFDEGRQILAEYKRLTPSESPEFAVFLKNDDIFCGVVSVVNNHFKYEFVNKD